MKQRLNYSLLDDWESRLELAKAGEEEGHPFRGNQYTTGVSGSSSDVEDPKKMKEGETPEQYKARRRKERRAARKQKAKDEAAYKQMDAGVGYHTDWDAVEQKEMKQGKFGPDTKKDKKILQGIENKKKSKELHAQIAEENKAEKFKDGLTEAEYAAKHPGHVVVAKTGQRNKTMRNAAKHKPLNTQIVLNTKYNTYQSATFNGDDTWTALRDDGTFVDLNSAQVESYSYRELAPGTAKEFEEKMLAPSPTTTKTSHIPETLTPLSASLYKQPKFQNRLTTVEIAARAKGMATDDYQGRLKATIKGGHTTFPDIKSGIPDDIWVSSDQSQMSFTFKNTNPHKAKEWVEHELYQKGIPISAIIVQPSGESEYADDWNDVNVYLPWAHYIPESRTWTWKEWKSSGENY